MSEEARSNKFKFAWCSCVCGSAKGMINDELRIETRMLDDDGKEFDSRISVSREIILLYLLQTFP